jgi:hypothetical protein
MSLSRLVTAFLVAGKKDAAHDPALMRRTGEKGDGPSSLLPDEKEGGGQALPLFMPHPCKFPPS